LALKLTLFALAAALAALRFSARLKLLSYGTPENNQRRNAVMKNNKYSFNPNWTVCPGEHVKEALQHHGVTQQWLAIKTKRPLAQVNRLINGRLHLSERWAIELEKAIGMSATYWLTLEMNHRLFLERKRIKPKKKGG
jgi:plasmid maintenance system antidote protein VapI